MRHRHLLLVPLVIALLCASSAAHAGGGSPSLVVAQLYASGGNSGATYANDYVELFNRGTSSVDLTGWTLQYASAASTSWSATTLAGTVAPGRAYLVQLASGGTNGIALPAADVTGTSNLAATGGKVAVVNGATPLSCGATAGSCAGSAGVADFVGYGTAADFEGADAAPAPDATSAIARAAGGCTDTDSNTGDFSTIAAAPSTRPRRPRRARAAAGRRRFRQRVGSPADPARDRDRARPADARLRRARGGGDDSACQRERHGHLQRHGGLHARPRIAVRSCRATCRSVFPRLHRRAGRSAPASRRPPWRPCRSRRPQT